MIHTEVIPTITLCHEKSCKGIQELELKVYRFANTGEPYMLRHCDKGDHHSLVIVRED